MQDRRQYPRRRLEGELAGVQTTVSVQILDISRAGVLLQCSGPVQIGDRGALRLSLGGQPFTADVEVQRVTSGVTRGQNYRVGVAFLGFTPEHAQLIERFISE
jgi:hypothetical protein